MTAVQWANKLIPASDGKTVLKTEGKTDDIVAEVIAAFKDSREQLTQFAPHLQAATLRQTLSNVWNFWKTNIRYKVDPDGQQWIQEPKALWQRKEGDCKSLSLAVMATLYALDIKASFRFASYGSNKEFPTHVYVVVKDKGKVIPVDCVWKEFGTQKPFKKNWDYNMTSIYRLSGIDEKQPVKKLFGKKLHAGMKVKGRSKGKLPKRGVLHLPLDKKITPQICDMLLKKQRLELEQKIHTTNNISGIGDTYDRAYEMQIAGLHNALAADMGWPRVTIAGFDRAVPVDERNDYAVSGIGCSCIPMQKEAATVEAIEGFFGKIFKGIGKGIKAVGKAVGKGAKAVGKGVFKVVSAPVKLVGKGVKAIGKGVSKLLTAPARNAIVNDLPQLAPFFLYTFITDPRILNRLPAVVSVKRNKALEYKKLLTGKLQISDSNFTGTVRNGILTQFGMSPEDVIAKWIRDTNYQIGFLGSVLSMASGLVGGLVKKVLGNVGENIGADAQQYAPAIEDWGQVPAAVQQEFAALTQQQYSNLQPMSEQQLYNNFNPGAGFNSPSYAGAQAAAQDNLPLDGEYYNVPKGYTLPPGATNNGDGTFTSSTGKTYPLPEQDAGGENQDYRDEKGFNKMKTLDLVESGQKEAGGGLWIAAAALGLLLMAKKGK